ncbi:MAG TPA: alpha-amylase family glycosyl hydrolase, partial [Propionibacteriaceae bacterium]|nr:alpha-amylase family glycosyl hydrolase [Propionibacteriaceae bacterium]
FRLEWTPEGARPTSFEGHGSLVTLNHDAPEVADMIADVMLHWLRRGIQGWRLDAAYAVPNEFWQRVLPRVRAEFGDAWFVGEVIHGDYPAIVAASGLDSVTEYELWKATWSSLADANFFELDWTLKRHNEMLAAFTPMTFIGNHDVNRIATVVGREAAVLAAAILFTVGGIPCVYYGDEYGYTGTKREDWGGDDEVRPIFPASVADISPIGAPVLRAYQDLIAIRRRHPWLTHAATTAVTLTNTHYVYDVVGRAGERLRVDLSLEGHPRASISDAAGSELWRLDV